MLKVLIMASLLNASAAHRWINCPPSLRWEEQLPKEQTLYALQGNTGHEYAATLIKWGIGWLEEAEYVPKVKELLSTGMLTEDLIDHCMEYAGYCVNLNMPTVYVEQGWDLETEGVCPQSYGYVDYLGYNKSTAYIVDFKYSRSSIVKANMNPQLLIYALIACHREQSIQDFHLVIHQSVLGHLEEYKISRQQLLQWQEEVLIPNAHLALGGGNHQFCVGEHCWFCSARSMCRQYYGYVKDLEDTQENTQDPRELTPQETVELFKKIDRIQQWGKAFKEDILKRLQGGEQLEGLCIKRRRGGYRLTDPEGLEERLLAEGYQDIYNTGVRLKPVAELRRIIGTNAYKELSKDYYSYREGTPYAALGYPFLEDFFNY
jgi:hypothetical protein